MSESGSGSKSSDPGSTTENTPGSRRGRMHDAEGAREALLNAAEEVFAEHGFDGARVDAIAETAGYNKSLIFQYFEDKLGLYAAVIRRADDQTRQFQNRVMLTLMSTDPTRDINGLKKLFGEYVGWYFDYLVENPRILRIFNWEMAEGWQTFSKIMTERDFQDVEDFAPVFAQFQSAGIMRAEPSPLMHFTTALFMSQVYLAILPLYNVLLSGADLRSAEALAHAREFVIEFIVNGLFILPGKRPSSGSKRKIASFQYAVQSSRRKPASKRKT
jgi:TetR/AcrR family transcriptional regulator